MKQTDSVFLGNRKRKSVLILQRALILVVLPLAFCTECFAQEAQTDVIEFPELVRLPHRMMPRAPVPPGIAGGAQFISSDIAQRNTPQPQRISAHYRFGLILSLETLLRDSKLDKILLEEPDGKRIRAFGRNCDNYHVIATDLYPDSPTFWLPDVFTIYIGFKTASRSNNIAYSWLQDFFNIVREDRNKMRTVGEWDLERIRQHFPSYELILNWWEASPKLPPACMEALKQDICRATGIIFPSWMRKNIIEAFKNIHASTSSQIEERIFYLLAGFWRGRIWRVYIGPFFIICITDGAYYTLASPDMANYDLRIFSY